MPIKFVLKRKPLASQPTNNQIIAEYLFDGNLFTIGSDSGNNLVLEQCAFEQAVIVREGEQVMLINSADGTQLNSKPLNREAIQPITIGDIVGVGDYLILVADARQVLAAAQAENAFSTNEEKVIDIYATTKNEPIDFYATTKFNLSEVEENKPHNGSVIEPQAQKIVSPPQNIEKPILNAEQDSPESAPQRNFAEILDTLRTEDDSFYFTVKNGTQETRRITLDQAETPLGTASNGEIVTAAENISTLCAVARKDWSGILIESQKSNAVAVNGEKITAPHRLRHDDEIIFAAAPKFSLVLHEPSSLVALESLLSTRSNPDARFGNLGTHNQTLATEAAIPEKEPKESLLERRYFKHFSFVEFASMIIGTLIGAVLIFLLLELLFT